MDNNRLSVNINYTEKSVLVYDLSISGLSCVYVEFSIHLLEISSTQTSPETDRHRARERERGEPVDI